MRWSVENTVDHESVLSVNGSKCIASSASVNVDEHRGLISTATVHR